MWCHNVTFDDTRYGEAIHKICCQWFVFLTRQIGNTMTLDDPDLLWIRLDSTNVKIPNEIELDIILDVHKSFPKIPSKTAPVCKGEVSGWAKA